MVKRKMVKRKTLKRKSTKRKLMRKCKKCKNVKCRCVRKSISKKYKKATKKARKYKQKGCSRGGYRVSKGTSKRTSKRRSKKRNKQRGGYNSACRIIDSTSLGEDITGYKYNDFSSVNGSMLSKSTQNYHPLKGGGFAQGAINFGLGNGLTFLRKGQNLISDIGRTWSGDHKTVSADPTVGGKNMQI